MGGTEFTLALTGGAFLLASWVDSRVGDTRRPSSLVKRFAHCVIGVLLLEGSVGALYLVQAAGGPESAVMAAVLTLFLPALVYTLLTALWLFRTLAEIMGL